MSKIAECVPNFSEGRDAKVLRRIETAIRGAGASLLDRHADPDHNRSVFTLTGSLVSLRQAVLDSAAVAVKGIDLRTHRGTHPRVGAIDVVPLVPLGDVRPAACVDAARDLGDRLWSELQLPVYFYGKAASRPARERLETVRKLGFERLAELARVGEVPPDVGGPELHPTAGACCVGVRECMVAFNVQLEGRDARTARRIARSVRQSAGGLPGVKALGMYLDSAGFAQVSMNLTDLGQTPVFAAFDAVCSEAAKLGATVLGSELVGLAPRAALGADPSRLRIAGFNRRMVLEDRLAEAGTRGDGGAQSGDRHAPERMTR